LNVAVSAFNYSVHFTHHISQKHNRSLKNPVDSSAVMTGPQNRTKKLNENISCFNYI